MKKSNEDKRPHLLVKGTAHTEPYIPSQGGGGKFELPHRIRKEHGTKLLKQLEQLREEAKELKIKQTAFATNVDDGILLQFESEPNFGLKTESLELQKSGIELFSVKQEDGKTIATVFVPEGKLEYFTKRVASYVHEETKSQTPKPKNKPLVESISNIRRAMLNALWTDAKEVFPKTEEEEIWWEVWLRVGDDPEAFLNFFKEYAPKLGLTIGEEEIKFPDRTVILAKGNKTQMSQSVNLLNCIAELRRAKETADFFTSMTSIEQHDWVDDAANRISISNKNEVAICILDTGVNNKHPLLINSLGDSDMHTYDPSWNVTDHLGHGTTMAGLALYGDLTDLLQSSESWEINHCLESVKILPPQNQEPNPPHLWGDITAESISRAEIEAPHRKRIASLAITTSDFRDRGQPSAWSAKLDALSSGADDETKRLIVVACGNTDPQARHLYPASNQTKGVHDPAQAWNALTVGAFTEKDIIDTSEYPGWKVIAPPGDLSPSSSTSWIWQKTWPLKPDIVLEGGNMAIDPQSGEASDIDSLMLLSTNRHFNISKPLTVTSETSAATAQASRMAAILQAEYPNYWPETIRALLVHSAEWTPAMLKRFQPLNKREKVENLLRYCGFGVPSLNAALWSGRNSLTLIAQDSLQPFDKAEGLIKSRDINIHAIPWPKEILQALGGQDVEMRVTLSYFIEPNPARRGWSRRYSYASHGLRFDVKRPLENVDSFRKRINQAARDEETKAGFGYAVADKDWVLGKNLRQLGSIHSDRWEGKAVELAEREYIAVFPVAGWWRERPQHGRWGNQARYSLVVTIKTPEMLYDIYASVASTIKPQIEIEV